MLARLFRWILPDDVDVMGTPWRTLAFTEGLRWLTNGMNVVARELSGGVTSARTDSRQGGER